MHVFLIHGADGSPDEHWFPWLRAELEKRGHTVHAPHLPEPRSLAAWRAAFRPYERFLDKECVLVGHSIGCAFLLDLLQRHRARQAILVAGFVRKLGTPYDLLNASFLEGFDWHAIRDHCPSFLVLHGAHDPYVSRARADELAGRLGVDVTVIPGAGHCGAELQAFPDALRGILGRSGR